MVFGSLFYLTVFLPPVLLGHWALQAFAGRWPRAATAAANLLTKAGMSEENLQALTALLKK